MRILCLNQFYWPDLAPTSQLLADFTRVLVREGHEVTVICGGSIYLHSDNSEKPLGVHIVRLPQPPFSRRSLGRILCYTSFFILALWHALRASTHDVVITMTTPPLISVIGTLVKRFRRARHFIWEMDLYPDIAVDVGVIRPNSLLARSIGTIADAQRRAADGVIAVGECMRDRLVARGIIGDHIHVVENWADGRVFYPRPGVPKAHVSIVYTGNFGLGHEEETLLGALPVLERDSRFRFAFIGGGSRHAHLKAWCCSRGFQNVVFKSYCTIAELTGTELAQSRIGLVLQASQCSGSIVPSKLYSMLASGLPVLFIGPESATPARIVKRFGCGWHVECGDVDGFTQLLQKLAECTSLIDDAGIRARQIFLERYDLEIGVGKLFSILGLEHNAARGHTSPERARAAPLSR